MEHPKLLTYDEIYLVYASKKAGDLPGGSKADFSTNICFPMAVEGSKAQSQIKELEAIVSPPTQK